MESADGSVPFEHHVKPTTDFYQLLLAQGDRLEVLEPESVRGVMRGFAARLTDYYGEEQPF